MEKRELRIWFVTSYPTTIIKDRYGGIYSEGEWLAFPLKFYEVPKAVNSNDVDCVDFWDNYPGPLGKGNTPEEAFEHLKKVIAEQLEEEVSDAGNPDHNKNM